MILEYIKECKDCSVAPNIREKLCPMCMTQKIIKGKWIVVILWLLRDNTLRFSELKRSIPDVTQTYLSKQLKSLEADKLVIRKSYNQVPPKVEYSLSNTGREFIKILDEMNIWGVNYMQEHVMPVLEEIS
jgi:DNA-binding HxlR family transcriptional regulator